MLRSHAERDASTRFDAGPVRTEGEPQSVGAFERAAVLRDPTFDEIHGGGADERRHEEVQRLPVDLERRADLLDEAVLHDDHPVAEGHRLLLVVGHVDAGRRDASMEFLQLATGLVAEFRIEVRQRFVEQEGGGIPDQGAAEGDTLLLAARHLSGPTIEQFLDAELTGRLRDPAIALVLGNAAKLQREFEIRAGRLVRVERVVLGDHRDVPILRRDVVHDPVTDPDLSGGDLLESGDHSKQRALAAARRTDQDEKLAVRDLQRAAADGMRAARVDLFDVGEAE